MQTQTRAILSFGTIGLVFLAGVLIVPHFVHGERGVAALPAVSRSTVALSAPPPPPPPVTTPRLFGNPSLSKTQIAFAFAGELWVVAREGGVARRLVSGQLLNRRPIFSPDGSQIAFTGVYDGNPDVYVVPAAGGEPRRLTYHPGQDTAVGWTADCTKIIFASTRRTTRDLPQLFVVPVTGGSPEQLPLPSGVDASPSPDGKRLAYVPIPQWQRAWKHYRGGQQSRIWIADLADSKIVKLPRDSSNDGSPMWIGDAIYFLSDRAGPVALHAYDVGSAKVREVARDPKGYDLRSASAGPGGIVYERVGQLSVLDLASGQAKVVPVTIADDLPQTRARFAKVEPDQVLHAALSPTGKRVVFEAHGELLSVPVEKGTPRNLTQSPAIADRDPAWSPDGKWVAWLSDRSGEYALYIMSPDGLGPMHVVPLGDPPSFFYTPRWSPDSRKLVVSDKRLNLWLVDVDHPTPQKIDTDRHDTPSTFFDPAWSPDSRWLAYVKELPNNLHAVFVYSVDDHATHQLTDGRSEALSPRFDRGGKYLWFLASTNLGPAAGWLDMSSYGRAVTSSVYAVVLRKDTPSPVAPESDEEGAGSGSGSGSGSGVIAVPRSEDNDRVRIDLDAIDQRVVALPIDRANYAGIEAGPPGTILLVQRPLGLSDDDLLEQDGAPSVPASVSKFDLKTRKTEKLIDRIDFGSPVYGGQFTFSVSADGQKLLYTAGQSWFVVATDHPAKPGEGAVKTEGLEVWVDPRAEWRQMFHEVWRIQRDFLYDARAHGLDLAAAEQVYAPFVEGIASRDDLNALFEEMLGHLVLGHVFVGGGAFPPQQAVSVGLLGADYATENGHYRITRILHGENWNPRLVAPLTQPGVVVKEGDYLLEVNGRDVATSEAVERAFLGTAGKQTVLTLAASADGHDARKVTVVPVPSEGQLRLRGWMEDNRAIVDRLSGGRVGYVFIPDTAAGGFTNFNRYYYSQIGKQAVVLDERFNHGGQVADTVINALRVEPVMGISGREGEDAVDPAQAIYGPKVMIANEMSGSGGDALPWLFKRAKLGPVVGTRTWGGLVGINGYPPLVDGGSVTAPRWGLYSAEGKWEIENIGVAPDVEVEQDPALVRTGHDPQLERAVALALEALASHPPAKLVRPPYPDYGPRLPRP
jgi:tricorn protease